jgi:hypothetical protein
MALGGAEQDSFAVLGDPGRREVLSTCRPDGEPVAWADEPDP